MRNLILSTATALALTGMAHAQDASAVESALDSGIAQLGSGGTSVSITSREKGPDNSLILNGVRIAPEDAEMVIEADFVKITPSADTEGEVTITLSPTVTLTGSPEPGMEPVVVTLATTGFALTTNQLLEAGVKPSFALVADSLSLTGGGPEHPMLKNLDVQADDLDVSFTFDEENRDADGAISIGTMKMDYTFADAATDILVGSNSETTEMNVTLMARGLPEDESGFEAFLNGGGGFRMTSESGGGSTSFFSTDPNMPMTIAGTGDAASMEISLLEGVFLLQTEAGQIDYVITPDPNVMPLPPFELGVSSMLMALRSPVAPSDNAEQARLNLSLRDIVVSDTVWGMIDPGATIPRDPATLEIDLTADVQLKKPLSDAPETDNPMDMAQVDRIDVNRVFLSLGGAMIEALGAVTVDNSSGFPMPDGAVDISVAGAQGLAQKLVDLGLVEQMQVGMMMGMMMAFAEPGDGPDTFSSKIEFKDGSVFANGQPIE